MILPSGTGALSRGPSRHARVDHRARVGRERCRRNRRVTLGSIIVREWDGSAVVGTVASHSDRSSCASVTGARLSEPSRHTRVDHRARVGRERCRRNRRVTLGLIIVCEWDGSVVVGTVASRSDRSPSASGTGALSSEPSRHTRIDHRPASGTGALPSGPSCDARVDHGRERSEPDAVEELAQPRLPSRTARAHPGDPAEQMLAECGVRLAVLRVGAGQGAVVQQGA